MGFTTAAGVFCALVLVGAASAAAPPEEGPARTFQPRDVFDLQVAGDPRIRPDGGAVVYVRSSYDIMTDNAARSIWLIDLASGAQTPLVEGPHAGSPRWSPDGKRLAYVSAERGAPQLYVRWMAAGLTAKVASLPQPPADIAWSPDGRRIAFTLFSPAEPGSLGAAVTKPEGAKWAEPLKIIDHVIYRADGEGYLKPGYNHIWVVYADGGAPRQLTFGPYDDGGALSWSADGRSILFAANRVKDAERQPVQADVYQVDVASASVTQLTHATGTAGAPDASPDGRSIAFVGFVDQHKPYQDTHLYVADRDGSHIRSIADPLDRPVDMVRWAADSRGLYAQYTDKSIVKVAKVSLDGKVEDVARGLGPQALDRPYTGGAWSVSNAGVVAFTQAASDHPADVAISAAGGARRLTTLNEGLLQALVLGAVTSLPVASSHDGQAIQAWIVTPPDFDPARKYPLILEIHGGPYGSYGAVWASEYQLYAAAGYVVVYANPRGSTSYGQAFADGIAYNYPGYDFDDLMSVVDAAVAKGSVDAARLYVTGGSGGGLMTAWIVGKTSRFRAAASQKPVINWTSEVLTTDGYTFMGPYWLGKNPWEDSDAYWRHSPLSLVGSVKTPTLVLVGEEDHRTPPSEAEQLYGALQLRGVPTTLIRVPGASHEGFAERPSQLTSEVSAILAWFDRYRSGG